MALWIQVVSGYVIVSAFMIILWFVQRKTRNAGIVDAGWAASVGFLAVFFAATSDGYPPRRAVVALLVAAWALRLAFYILKDRVLGKPEEGRYVTLREEWGASAEKRIFLFYQYQAFFAFFFAIPSLIIAHHPVPSWGIFDTAGVLLWVVSVGNTILSDHQLFRFRSEPGNRGKTCRRGWWRYSRHPNYFFEWLHWWSYVALAAWAPFWWASLLAPAMMLFLLLRVTGIPPTEAQALASRGEDYREYQRTTSKFIPWFPLKQGKSL